MAHATPQSTRPSTVECFSALCYYRRHPEDPAGDAYRAQWSPEPLPMGCYWCKGTGEVPRESARQSCPHWMHQDRDDQADYGRFCPGCHGGAPRPTKPCTVGNPCDPCRAAGVTLEALDAARAGGVPVPVQTKPCPADRCRQMRFFGSTGGHKHTRGHPQCEQCRGSGTITVAVVRATDQSRGAVSVS